MLSMTESEHSEIERSVFNTVIISGKILVNVYQKTKINTKNSIFSYTRIKRKRNSVIKFNKTKLMFILSFF